MTEYISSVKNNFPPGVVGVGRSAAQSEYTVNVKNKMFLTVGGREDKQYGENAVLTRENFRPNRLKKLFTSNQNQKTKTLQTQHT